MRVFVYLIASALVCCGQGVDTSSPASATLTPHAVTATPPFHVKSTGRVTWAGERAVWVRVDYASTQESSLDNALIALRTDQRTTYALAATAFSDLRVGDRITFGFDPRTLDEHDGSYLAGVIGRVRE